MRRTKSPLFATLLLVLCGGWMASCSEDEDLACTPQLTRLCAGVGRCEGVQACLADGSGWAACDCSGPPRQAVERPGEEDADPDLIGAACADDEACGPGLICYTSGSNDFLGGGAPNGYCSLPCEADSECTTLDPSSACVVAVEGAPGVCVRTCRSLDPTSANENKCLSRRDLACNSEAYLGIAEFTGARQNGLCYPQCSSDEDCAGRSCDLARGLCVDELTAGLPIGAACTENVECSGRLCIRLGGDQGFCSAPCVLGQPIGCGFGLTAGARGAGCLLPLVRGFLSTEGDGDVGFCVELCADSSECAQADQGWSCELTEDAEALFNRPGICDAPDLPDAGAGADAGPVDASAPSTAGDAG